MELREYQKNILETAKKHNTLVVLPTGLGKTLIALALAEHRIKKYPDSKILFLAPTRPLVEQHYNTLKDSLYNKFFKETHIFTGKISSKIRSEIWKKADIIFSTPQCIENDLKKSRISLENVSLLIEDEAHRCLRKYSYTYVAQDYAKKAKNQRILGLTASPGSSESVIKKISKNLNLDAIEIRTRESKDVKPYLQKLTKEIIKVELTEKMKKIKSLILSLYSRKVEELKNRKLLFARPTKTNLIELQKRLQKKIMTGNKHFNILKGVSVCAQAIKLQYSLELLETQTIESTKEYLRELFKQAEQKKSRGVEQLAKSKELIEAYHLVYELYEKNEEHPKLNKLKEIVKPEIEENKKIIIFSQYRNTVRKINSELTKTKIKSKVFVGQLKKKGTGLSQKEQKLILNEFRKGLINVLVSTSIAEEGLDLPEVNMVIFYEPIPSAIRKIQRAGRTARLKPGKLVILMAKGTRDESHHWAAHHKERKMHTILNNMQEKFKKDKKSKQQRELSGFS